MRTFSVKEKPSEDISLYFASQKTSLHTNKGKRNIWVENATQILLINWMPFIQGIRLFPDPWVVASYFSIHYAISMFDLCILIKTYIFHANIVA